MHFFKRLSDTTKGIFLIVMGIVLLLHVLGILSVSLNAVVLLFSIALIAAGAYLMRDRVSTFINSNNKKP